MKRIGIFGGAFNPPHVAHTQIIEIVKRELKLDYVVILPSNNPPHKKILITKKNRKQLIELAFLNKKDVVIDYYEFDNNEINYTINTIKYLKEKYTGDLFYIIGGDSLINFDKWKKPIEILNTVNLVVLSRGNDIQKIKSKINYFEEKSGKKIYFINEKPIDISSSILRFYLSTDLNKYKEYIDEKVYNFILINKIYGNYQNIINDLKIDLTESRFNHSLRVVEFALKLNSVTLRLDDQKIILASLLHDVAKPISVIEEFLSNDYDYKDKIINNILNENKNSPVLHAFIGPYIVKKRYNIQDEEILSAIRYHTTGRENMSSLEKLIFVSDMLEEGRDFIDVQNLRDLVFQNFEEGFKECIKKTYKIVSSKTKDIFYLTKEAYNFYIGR